MEGTIRASLVAVYDEKIVDELLDAYEELKSEFYEGGLRLSEVEGGRFAEAAFRLLQQETTGKYTALGRSLDTEKTIKDLANLATGSHPDSVRLHIPRALRVIYDVRNNRDAAHLADGIDPNVQDATLVASVADWVMAEFVRLHHNVSADEAQRIVEELVTRKAPVIQDFQGALKILNPKLGASDQCLVLLYQRGAQGATYAELEQWVHPRSRANLRRTLRQLDRDKAFVHESGDEYRITRTGQREVETRKLTDPDSRPKRI
jgi:hypothetical protein